MKDMGTIIDVLSDRIDTLERIALATAEHIDAFKSFLSLADARKQLKMTLKSTTAEIAKLRRTLNGCQKEMDQLQVLATATSALTSATSRADRMEDMLAVAERDCAAIRNLVADAEDHRLDKLAARKEAHAAWRKATGGLSTNKRARHDAARG